MLSLSLHRSFDVVTQCSGLCMLISFSFNNLHLDYGNFKLTNLVARNEESIFIVTSSVGSIVGRWPLVLRSIGTLVARGLCPISVFAVV